MILIPGLRQLLLQLLNGLAGLGRLAAVASGCAGEQVLGSVAFVEDDAPVEILAAPADELLQTCFVLSGGLKSVGVIKRSDLSLTTLRGANGTTRFKKCKQLFEYKHLLLLTDIWRSNF